MDGTEDRMFSSNAAAMENEYQAALNKVTHDIDLANVAFRDLAIFIARTTGEVLDCQRASVWKQSEDPDLGRFIYTITQWDRQTGQLSEPAILDASNASSFLDSLASDSLLIIDDVAADPRCVELNRGHLPADDIKSMLCAPWQCNGEFAGLLCLEEGQRRSWQELEQHFCTRMTSLLSMAAEQTAARPHTTSAEARYSALGQQQKMDAMRQLTGGIAHDFNNILAILMGNLELAKQTSSEQAPIAFIDAALKGVGKGVALTQRLLEFARRSVAPGVHALHVNQIIVELRDLLAQFIGGGVSLTLNTCDAIWMTRINRAEFEDAIIILCVNARDAMPDGGDLLITTDNRTLTPGDHVLISVSDTGVGMDEKARNQMSSVFGFVQRSGGQILVNSIPGEGTTIDLYLPRCAPGADPEIDPPAGLSN